MTPTERQNFIKSNVNIIANGLSNLLSVLYTDQPLPTKATQPITVEATAKPAQAKPATVPVAAATPKMPVAPVRAPVKAPQGRLYRGSKMVEEGDKFKFQNKTFVVTSVTGPTSFNGRPEGQKYGRPFQFVWAPKDSKTTA